MKIAWVLLFLPIMLGCANNDLSGDGSLSEQFYFEKKQINKYFIVERKNIDNLSANTVLSLRNIDDIEGIPKYLGTLCEDYEWMHSRRFIYIFEDRQSAELHYEFIGKTDRTLAKNVQRKKYIAKYNPDEKSVTFYPLVREDSWKVYIDKNWCKR